MSKYPSPNIKRSATLKEFLDIEISELLPNQDIMIKNHLNLVEYLESGSPFFVLRKFKNYSNRGSNYSFEIHANQLRVFPIPNSDEQNLKSLEAFSIAFDLFSIT